MTDPSPDDAGWPPEYRRVVFVGSQLPTLGGGYTFVENLSAALSALGVGVVHVSLRPPSRTPVFPTTVVFPRWELLRGPVVRGHGNPWKRAWALPVVALKPVDRARCRRRLRRLLAQRTPDTVLVFTDVAAKVEADRAGFVRAGGDGPVIGQHHTSYAGLGAMPWVEPAMRAHYQDLDALVVLTPQDAEGFRDLVAVRTRAIPNPVPPRPASTHRGRDAVAVSLSRYSPEKRLDLLVRCFAEATRTPDLRHWQLHLYGDGPERTRIAAEIERWGVGDRVRIRGATSDVHAVLDRARIHLLASSVEGLPVSAVEAAVSGVPTLAFLCSPGVAEVVTPATGFPVEGDDPTVFTEHLEQALRRPAELERRGSAAREAATVYDPQRVVREWGELLRSLHEEGGR